MQAGLVTNTFIEAMRVQQSKIRYGDYSLSDANLDRLKMYQNEPEFYSRLAKSIAPEIYGHLDVKKALLLLSKLNVANEDNISIFPKYLPRLILAIAKKRFGAKGFEPAT